MTVNVECGNSSAIPLLLSSGSDVNAVDHSGATAVEIVDNKLRMLTDGDYHDFQEHPADCNAVNGEGVDENDPASLMSHMERDGRATSDMVESEIMAIHPPDLPKISTFARQLRQQGLRVSEKYVDVERWKCRYMECQSMLLSNGAVKRAILTVPVEQDCRDITFSYSKNGSYCVATATPWALVTRITTFPYFTSIHAAHLLATYRLYLSPILLLRLIQLRFYSLHSMHIEAVNLVLQDPMTFFNAGVFFIEEKQVIYRLQMLERIAKGSSTNSTDQASIASRPDTVGKSRPSSAPFSSANMHSEGPLQYVKGVDSHVITDFSGRFEALGRAANGSPSGADLCSAGGEAVGASPAHDRVTFRSVHIGKITALDSVTPDSLIERLMRAVNGATSGVELFYDYLMLLVRKRYVRINNLRVERDFVNDGAWSLKLYDSKYFSDAADDAITTPGGEIPANGAPSNAGDAAPSTTTLCHAPISAFCLSCLELTCKPGHRLMRGKVVLELRATLNNSEATTPLTSCAYLMEHCRDELHEVFATILQYFVHGKNWHLQLVPPEDRYKLISPSKAQSSKDIRIADARSSTGYATMLQDNDRSNISRSLSDLGRDRRALHSLESEIKHHESLPSVFHGMKIVEKKASGDACGVDAYNAALASPGSSRKGLLSERQSEASEYSNRSSGSISSPQRALASHRSSESRLNSDVNVASLRGCMQLLTTWCTEFFEDDFERDGDLRHKMALFLTELMERNGELIEEEFDPNAFTPFLDYEPGEDDVLCSLPSDARDTSCAMTSFEALESTEPTRQELVRRSVVVRRTTEGPQQRPSIFSRRMSQKAHAPMRKRGTTLMNVFMSVYDTYDDDGSFGERNSAGVSGWCILSLKPQDVAEQLTLLEHDLFCRIKRNELIDSKQTTYANLKELQSFSVHVMDFMISQVVASASMEEVTEKIAFLLTVSKHMQKIRNYNGMFEVLTVLETTSVYRLKSAWSKLGPESVAQHASLKALFSSRAGFQAFRKFLVEENCQPPCLPYMGLYLKDIIYILQLPNYASPGIVNVTKMGSLACKVMEIHSYQSTPYHFLSQPETIDVLKSVPQFSTEDDQYNASLRLEPVAARHNSAV